MLQWISALSVKALPISLGSAKDIPDKDLKEYRRGIEQGLIERLGTFMNTVSDRNRNGTAGFHPWLIPVLLSHN